MGEDKKIIREDINFLEYANWVIDPQAKATSFVIEKENSKYEILSPRGLPTHFDKLLLYFLLHKLHSSFSIDIEIEITRYEIARNICRGVGKPQYARIIQSLQKWNAVSLSFMGTFYASEGYTIRFFHVIDNVTLHKDSNKIRIKFNSEYIRQLRETKYFKLIDYELYKQFTKPITARLYEVLVKSFKDRSVWVIGSELLAEKAYFRKRPSAKQVYLSDIMVKLIPAAKEINEKSEMRIEITCNKINNVIVFKKVKTESIKFEPASRINKNSSDIDTKNLVSGKGNIAIEQCWTYYQSLPVEQQQVLIGEIDRNPFNRSLSNNNPDALKAKIFTYMKQHRMGPMNQQEA